MDDYIIQSYYNQYTIKKTKLTPLIINAIQNINDADSYEIITGIKCKNKKLNVYYWV